MNRDETDRAVASSEGGSLGQITAWLTNLAGKFRPPA